MLKFFKEIFPFDIMNNMILPECYLLSSEEKEEHFKII